MEIAVRKRLIIISIYAAIIIVFGLIIYFATRPVETCFDGKKNQNEEDIDCGGVCGKCNKISALDIRVSKAGYLETGTSGQYDVYAIINNPNQNYGAKSFDYTFSLKDGSGKILSQKSGTSYILPGEEKYLVEADIVSTEEPIKVELEIKNYQWIQAELTQKPDFKIVYKEYKPMTSGTGFAQAVGILKNESPYDFNIITIRVVLLDSDNNVVGLNYTDIRTVKSGEEREFRALWPQKFPGADHFDHMDIRAEVNVQDPNAFYRK